MSVGCVVSSTRQNRRQMSEIAVCLLAILVFKAGALELAHLELEQVLANGDVRKSPLNQAQRNWNAEVPGHDTVVKSTRIIEGRYAKPGEIPYLVVISFFGHAQWCGGAIYSRDTIITAAHCFFIDGHKIPLPELVFTAGEFDMEKLDKTEMRRRVASVAIPDDYDPNNFPNDIAVVKLEEPFRFTYWVQPLPVAEPGIEYGDKLFIGGFGYVRKRRLGEEFRPGGYSSVLKVASVKRLTTEECTKVFDGNDELVALVQHPTYYCAGGQTSRGKSADACQGDSGGPAACVDDNGRKHLCGVISAGTGCGVPGVPGFFTNVSYYHSYIQQHAGKPDTSTR